MIWPTFIRIGYRDYRLVPVVDGPRPHTAPEQATHPLTEDDAGETNAFRQTIHYWADAPRQGVANTILHECLHGIAADADVFTDKEEWMEEHVVSTLANGLCALIQNNPKLFATLQAALTPVNTYDQTIHTSADEFERLARG